MTLAERTLPDMAPGAVHYWTLTSSGRVVIAASAAQIDELPTAYMTEAGFHGWETWRKLARVTAGADGIGQRDAQLIRITHGWQPRVELARAGGWLDLDDASRPRAAARDAFLSLVGELLRGAIGKTVGAAVAAGAVDARAVSL